jgi:cytochrome c553
MPRHIARLIVLMVAFLALAYGAKRYFTVDSFYDYGHYRGRSVEEIASDKPKYKGTANCEGCHAEIFAQWSTGIHHSVDVGKIVKCEVCHGPAGGRDSLGMFVNAATGPDHPANLKLAVPTDTRQLCTLCHEKMTGRPAQQPQIVVAEHAGDQQCTACHNPHSPLLGLVSAASAAPAPPRGNAEQGKAKAEVCAACHGPDGVSVDLPGPTLAGQRADYIVASIKAYATGARDNPVMSPVAQGLESEDADDVAAHFSGLKCESALSVAAPKAAAICVTCHGANGQSKIPAAPNLVGQTKDYLLAALAAYKDGTRKNDMMADTVKNLSDADAESAAAYYAGASCKRD